MKGNFTALLRSISSTISLALLVIGFCGMLATGAMWGYREYEHQRVIGELTVARQTPADASRQSLAKVPAMGPSAPEATTPAEPSGLEAATPETQAAAPAPEAATPEPTPKPIVPASRIAIPEIEVDSPIVEAKIENHEWQVPKFVVGHLQGTANPNENGNVVLSGHLESLTSGNVFSRLNEMKVDDEIVLFAGDEQILYRVREIKRVENTDVSVVAPTDTPTLTLITCTGTFNYVTRDFNQRLVVIAEPEQDSAPEEENPPTDLPII